MKNIIKIILGFENLEQIEIDSKYIGIFYTGKINSYFSRIASNYITKINECNELFIEISKNSNLKTQFGDFYFDRICKKCDIVSITFIYDNNEREEYYFPYDEENKNIIGSKNNLQKSYISYNGNLYISINCNLEDYINFDKINDKDYNKKFKLYL